MKILLAITFVFGVLKIITHLKIFNVNISYVFEALFGAKNQSKTLFGGMLILFDVWFFYFSLIFQAYYWLFRGL